MNLGEDLIEEIIRIKGFDNIKLVEPSKNRIKDTLNFKQNFSIYHRDLSIKRIYGNSNLVIYSSKLTSNFLKVKKKFQYLIQFHLILMF